MDGIDIIFQRIKEQIKNTTDMQQLFKALELIENEIKRKRKQEALEELEIILKVVNSYLNDTKNNWVNINSLDLKGIKEAVELAVEVIENISCE